MPEVREHYRVLFYTGYDPALTLAMKAAADGANRVMTQFAWDVDEVSELLPGVGQDPVEYFVQAIDRTNAVVFVVGGQLAGRTKDFSETLWRRWSPNSRPWVLVYFAEDIPLPKGVAETQRYLEVQQFRERVDKQGLCSTFKAAADFRQKVQQHLVDLAQKLKTTAAQPKQAPIVPYLESLKQRYDKLALEGISAGPTRSLPLERIYVKLRFRDPSLDLEPPRDKMPPDRRRHHALHDVLPRPKPLTIVGAPARARRPSCDISRSNSPDRVWGRTRIFNRTSV